MRLRLSLGLVATMLVAGVAGTTFAGKVYFPYGYDEIRRVNLTGWPSDGELELPSAIRDFAMDPVRGLLFVALNDGKFYRVELNGDEMGTLVLEEFLTPGLVSELEVDPRGKLYWSDANGIQRSELDGSGAETVVPVFTNQLVMDFPNDLMYWSDGGDHYRSGLDGSNIEAVPNYVLGTDSERIYWGECLSNCDSVYGHRISVFSSDLNGDDVQFEFETADGSWFIGPMAWDDAGFSYFVVHADPDHGGTVDELRRYKRGVGLELVYDSFSPGWIIRDPSVDPGMVVLTMDHLTIHWAAPSESSGYHFLRGGLGELHSSGGDFSVATHFCILDTTTTEYADVPPPSGTGYFYLVAPWSQPTFNSFGYGQVASRNTSPDGTPILTTCNP